VNQKLISRKEHNPIPSQPRNITIKLSAATRTNIKNVNKEIYARKRGRCGSSDIYDNEYVMTKKEIKETTKSIKPQKLSTAKLQFIISGLANTQEPNSV